MLRPPRTRALEARFAETGGAVGVAGRQRLFGGVTSGVGRPAPRTGQIKLFDDLAVES
jgi:hypothetical protein